MARYCIVVDLDKCTGCQTCEVACKIENNIALGEKWNKVIERGPFGEFPHIEKYWLPVMCQQCTNAPCVNVCPTGASYRDPETNVVLIDKEKCIGCKYCMMACPYGVRDWNENERVVEKCTLCSHLTATGELPYCGSVCPNECRYYGDLDDPDSDVSKALAAESPESLHQLRNKGNDPSTVYILSSKICTWREEA